MLPAAPEATVTSEFIGDLTAAFDFTSPDFSIYDVIITANTSDGFTRRYAGRIA